MICVVWQIVLVIIVLVTLTWRRSQWLLLVVQLSGANSLVVILGLLVLNVADQLDRWLGCWRRAHDVTESVVDVVKVVCNCGLLLDVSLEAGGGCSLSGLVLIVCGCLVRRLLLVLLDCSRHSVWVDLVRRHDLLLLCRSLHDPEAG